MILHMSLTQKLSQAFKHLRGQATLSEKNIELAVQDVEKALTEADVARPVVQSFILNIKEHAIGQSVLHSLNPQEAFLKIVKDELIKHLGASEEECAIKLNHKPPVVILMAGLQGSGKTTSTAKIAKSLKAQGKQVMMTSVDVYRAAAIDQLHQLANTHQLTDYVSQQSNPVDMCVDALKHAKQAMMDVLIIDTAGRLHIDSDLMDELKQIHQVAKPSETLFVVDSMMGQDALHAAQHFSHELPLTGIVLTKTDAESGGGAALSVKQITGAPIKFIGTGENINDMDAFNPERAAMKMLDLGDIEALIKKAEAHISQDDAKRSAEKLKSGQFNFVDFKQQLVQLRQMGGFQSVLSMLPGAAQIPQHVKDAMDESKFKTIEVIIDSMTVNERLFPMKVINSESRKRRIIRGSGKTKSELNELLKQFQKMQKMMKKFSSSKMQKMMNMLGKGQMPDSMQ